jgi:hypothetical protein
MSEQKSKRRYLWVFGYVSVLVIAFFIIKSEKSRGFSLNEEYKQKVQNALGEISFASSDSFSEVSAATDDLSDFMLYRAGIQLNQSNKNLLNSVEQDFWGNSKRISEYALTEIITELAIQQIPQLSNSEIASITESFRGFTAPGIPTAYAQGRDYTRMRASGRGRMLASNFSTELTSLRDGEIDGKIAQNLIRLAVAAEVGSKIKVIRDAEPNFFGGTDSEMTPIQALFVTYAVVTDDQLLYDQAGLFQDLQSLHQGLQQVTGQSFPSPQGYKAYGDNGYSFSSPASIVMSDANVASLITLIQARGN